MRFRGMIKYYCTLLGVLVFASGSGQETGFSSSKHPTLYVSDTDKADIKAKIKSEPWAAESWKNILSSIDKYVTQHQTDPQWIVSRLAMYWKDGERYTQCFINKGTWDHGTGNAPVPTVRLPGMRVWNEYVNVPLDERVPFNETGDMKATSRINPKTAPMLIPYKKTGHLIRGNNNEILTLAEKASFVYWITGEEKYAKFAADIFNAWLIGTYYMNPVMDMARPATALGGYEPGGILGYYDYEQIHDDLQTHAAVIYDFLYSYLNSRPTPAIKETGKSYNEVASIVFKRFVEIGMVRGGKKGNWNINGWNMILPSILVLDSGAHYADEKGKNYYLNFYIAASTKYHDALPEILKDYDPVTGLWGESPGYALGTITSLLDMAMPVYKAGVNTIDSNPVMQKAALAIFPWLDARGNIVNFGDSRGGPGDFTSFERLLTHYTWTNNQKNAAIVASAIKKGINANQYNRSKADWKGLCLNVAKLPASGDEIPYARTAYSPIHRHIVMKNGNDEQNGLMFTLNGGYPKQRHLSPNGLALQLYGKGWALAPDASGYESYWSADYNYHQTATGSNTILPGYTAGPIHINGMEPEVDSLSFTSTNAISEYCSFSDVSAVEKRRTVAMIRTSATAGYYVDIFRSRQNDNDYIYHNLGDTLQLKSINGKGLALVQSNIDTVNIPEYKYFKNSLKASAEKDFYASWIVSRSKPAMAMDMWMKGEANREVYQTDAPATNLSNTVTPNKVNIAPESTPTILIRQKNADGWKHPFLAVFEPYSANEKSIQKISSMASADNFVSLLVESKALNNELSGRKEFILNAVDDELYKPGFDIQFRGTLGIAAENAQGFKYLYLGKGNLLQKGNYKIEASYPASAGIVNKSGKLFYSASVPIKITVPYPASRSAYPKLRIFYQSEGKFIEAQGTSNANTGIVTGHVPAGYDIAIKVDIVK